MATALATTMRTPSITVVVPALLAALTGLVHADRHQTIAALTEPVPARLSTGELRLTGPARPTRLPSQLEATDVTAEMASQRDAIERCYLDHVRDIHKAGQLDVLFDIGRDGHVRSVAASAPALTPYSAPTVTRCIRAIAHSIQFPARRNDTTVVIPYLFQATTAEGAGPQLSCWSPKGCH